MLPTRNKASSAESRTRAKPRKPGGSHCTTLTSEITPRMMMPCLGDLSKRQTQSNKSRVSPDWSDLAKGLPHQALWDSFCHCAIHRGNLYSWSAVPPATTANMTNGHCDINDDRSVMNQWNSSLFMEQQESLQHTTHDTDLQSYIYYIYDHTWSYMAIRNNTVLCWKQGMLHAAMKFVDASTTALAKNRLISQFWAVIKVCRTKLSNELSNCQMSNAQCEQIHKLWTTFEQMSISFVQYHPRDVNTTPTTPRPSGLGWCKR